MIKLYGFMRSRSNRPHWALEELEVPYEFYQLDFSKGDNRSNFFLSLNSAGKMPVLEDGDLVLTESAAICNYLGEKFPEKGLTPAAGTREKALYDQWMFFILCELEQPLWTKGKHTFAIPEKVRVPAILDTALWEFEKAVKLASDGLGEKEFMVGDQFTMVDICLAHTMIWATKFEFPVPHPNLMAHMDRMMKRPSFERMLKCKQLEIPRD